MGDGEENEMKFSDRQRPVRNRLCKPQEVVWISFSSDLLCAFTSSVWLSREDFRGAVKEAKVLVRECFD